MKTLSSLWRLAALIFVAALPASAQSFRVQCPTGTITHPDPTNSGVNNSEPAYTGPTTFTINGSGYYAPATNVNGAIKCQQVSGGDGYSTMANGVQTFMFSFGPLSGLAAIANGQPGTEFPAVFNTTPTLPDGVTPTTLLPGDPATSMERATTAQRLADVDCGVPPLDQCIYMERGGGRCSRHRELGLYL